MENSVDFIKILLAIVAAVIALLVRMPTAYLITASEEKENAYTDDTGLPYFTDPDSYYHVRLVDNVLKTGMIADKKNFEGEPWDMHSYYPEGRSAVYQPGIVYLTIALWKIFNLSVPMDISRVEFYLSGFMAMITAVVAFISGCRNSGKISGFVAGILVSCAPAYASRTSFGRFDTDVFVVLMNVLLIMFIMEILRADELRKQILFGMLFILISVIYAFCWAPQFSSLFVGLTIVAGLIYVAVDTVQYCDKSVKKYVILLSSNTKTILLMGIGLLVLLIIGVIMGLTVIEEIFSPLSFEMTRSASEGSLPNIFDSISELRRMAFVPDNIVDWIRGYTPGAMQTTITGVGGLFAAIAALGGLTVLFFHSYELLSAKNDEPLESNCSLMYLVILGIWLIAGLFLTSLGMRFVEILSTPIGLLAAVFVGYITRNTKGKNLKWRIVKVVVSVVAIGIIIIPDLEGIFFNVRVPTVTDASSNAMKWIKENADDPEAVIESWWDMGYYYESESGHPCLWDGGSQDAIRALLFSRALTENDIEMSCRIFNMLACSGNRAVDLLMEYTDPQTAFETLWTVFPMDKENSCAIISNKCGMNAEDARKVEEYIHPNKSKEIYLVITYSMVNQIALYEYYSNWDFTGKQIPPYELDESEIQHNLNEKKQEEIDNKRSGYTMLRLFIDMEENSYFIPQYECYDGIEGVRVWKVTNI